MFRFIPGHEIRKFIICLLLFCISPFALAVSLPAQDIIPDADWDSWQFLLGDWVGGGVNNEDSGTGTFSFSLELQDRIIVRKDHFDFSKTKAHPAYSHDGLMIIYQKSPVSAVYFGSEGHIVNYKVQVEQNKIVFLSDNTPFEPVFRITYIKEPNDTLSVLYEIARPEEPEIFSLFLEGIARKNEKKSILELDL